MSAVYLHYMCITCALHVHYMCITRALHAHQQAGKAATRDEAGRCLKLKGRPRSRHADEAETSLDVLQLDIHCEFTEGHLLIGHVRSGLPP